MTARKYIKYECLSCRYNRQYLSSEDPVLLGCPKCGKRNSFFKRVVEKKIKRGKVKRKRWK